MGSKFANKTTEEKVKALQDLADYRIEGAKKDVESFKKRLEENPMYAFEWSEDAIRASATIDAYLKFKANLQWVTEQPDIEKAFSEMLNEWIEDAISESCRVESSTSVVNNFIKTHRKAIGTNIIRVMQGKVFA